MAYHNQAGVTGNSTTTAIDYYVAGGMIAVDRRVLLPRQVALFSQGSQLKAQAEYTRWQFLMTGENDELTGTYQRRLRTGRDGYTPDNRSYMLRVTANSMSGFTGRHQRLSQLNSKLMQHMEAIACESSWDCHEELARIRSAESDAAATGIVWSDASSMRQSTYPKWYCRVPDAQVPGLRRLLDEGHEIDDRFPFVECWDINEHRWMWLYELTTWSPVTCAAPGVCLKEATERALVTSLCWMHEQIYIGGNGFDFAVGSMLDENRQLSTEARSSLEQSLTFDSLAHAYGWKSTTVKFPSDLVANSVEAYRLWQRATFVTPALELAHRVINHLPESLV